MAEKIRPLHIQIGLLWQRALLLVAMEGLLGMSLAGVAGNRSQAGHFGYASFFNHRFCAECTGVDGEYLSEFVAKRDPRVSAQARRTESLRLAREIREARLASASWSQGRESDMPVSTLATGEMSLLFSPRER